MYSSSREVIWHLTSSFTGKHQERLKRYTNHVMTFGSHCSTLGMSHGEYYGLNEGSSSLFGTVMFCYNLTKYTWLLNQDVDVNEW